MDINNALMVYTGFKINNLSKAKGITLIQPPFLKWKIPIFKRRGINYKGYI